MKRQTEMKKYIAKVWSRKFSNSNDWKREKDLVIFARNETSAYNKLDKIGRKMTNDYCQVEGYLEEVKEVKD